MRRAPDRPPLLVVALGGNAMQDPRGDDSIEADFARTTATARGLVDLIADGAWRLVVVHGNGPQVGNHLLRSELGHDEGGLPLLPLDVCVADTQGGMGYMIQQSLANAFADRHLPAVVASVVTQVVVDRDDPAFATPSKPVGEIITEERVQAYVEQGWAVGEDRARRGWRRLVASPEPQEIVEAEAVRALVDAGVVVIAAGGGGIPVVQTDDGLRGIAAVVDKDLAAALLAIDLGADALLILTDVDRVYLDHGTEQQRALDEISAEQARSYAREGQFGAGSMAPKVEALARFAQAHGGTAAIASVARASDALRGTTGTRIVP